MDSNHRVPPPKLGFAPESLNQGAIFNSYGMKSFFNPLDLFIWSQKNNPVQQNWKMFITKPSTLILVIFLDLVVF